MSLIEIAQISIQILFIFFIFSCTTLLYENNKIFKKKIFYDFDKIIINSIILLNIFIFTSVLNINQKYILIIYIITFLLSFRSKLFKENLKHTYINTSFIICFIIMNNNVRLLYIYLYLYIYVYIGKLDLSRMPRRA